MAIRAAALLLLLALPSAGAEQDRKPPTKKPAVPTDLETDHWIVDLSVPTLPDKDFENLLEQYFKLWQRKVGPEKGPAGKLKLKMYFDREEFNGVPNRTGGYAMKDDQLHVLADNSYGHSIANGGVRAYLAAAYPGLSKRTDLPAWFLAGLSSYLACAVFPEGQVEIDPPKHRSEEHPSG